MLNCGTGGGEEYFTSSGVVVRDRKGERWLTVSSHGFPLGREIVYHPSAGNTSVGAVQKTFGGTDILLGRLHNTIKS